MLTLNMIFHPGKVWWGNIPIGFPIISKILTRSQMLRTSSDPSGSVCRTVVAPLCNVKYRGIPGNEPAQSYTSYQ